jgi:pyruvate formate lyase activating enzyme
MADWVAKNLGPDVPLHFLRFFPQHKLAQLPPTPLSTLERACAIAREAGLHYVYIGNVPGHKANHTYCPKCRRLLIERKGYFVERNDLKEGACPSCGQKIPGVWK